MCPPELCPSTRTPPSRGAVVRSSAAVVSASPTATFQRSLIRPSCSGAAAPAARSRRPLQLRIPPPSNGRPSIGLHISPSVARAVAPEHFLYGLAAPRLLRHHRSRGDQGFDCGGVVAVLA